MAYDVHITDQDYKPLQATVRFFDVNGTEIGSTEISASGGQFPQSFVNSSFAIRVSANGYYDFDAPTANISSYSNDITLQKKPGVSWMPYAFGAAIGILIAKLFRL